MWGRRIPEQGREGSRGRRGTPGVRGPSGWWTSGSTRYFERVPKSTRVCNRELSLRFEDLPLGDRRVRDL